MKKIYTVFLLTALSLTAVAQNSESNENPASIAVSSDSEKMEPYYIIIADNKQFTIDRSKRKSGDDKALNFIEPDWIEKVNVYKGDKAIEKYGTKGENGVVSIELKKNKLKRISKEAMQSLILLEG